VMKFTGEKITLKPIVVPEYVINDSEGKTFLTITSDGRMLIGDGLSEDEATQRVAKMLAQKFGSEVSAREAADLAEIGRLKDQLALLGGAASAVVLSGRPGKLLDVLKACTELHDLVAYKMMMEAIVRVRDDPA